MTCFFWMVFMKKKIIHVQETIPLEEPKVNEAPRVAGFKGGEIQKEKKKKKKVDPTERLKKAIQKEIKIKT